MAQSLRLPVPRQVQPDDVSCGPTALSSVLRFYGAALDLPAVRAATPVNPDGGTLAPHLGSAALVLGYQVRAHPLALGIFDPTWRDLPPAELRDRLDRRTLLLPDGRTRRVHQAWRAFLDAGGQVVLGELRAGELVAALDRGHPLICGLSVTWLYQQARERAADNEPDDIGGEPVGHFVVVCGYEDSGRSFVVADPWPQPPFAQNDGLYVVSRRRLTQAILLGDATHDAVIVEVLPHHPYGAHT